jgi:3-hydroxyisobutyrate dehydrogenase-like beta-hydroxyacid dehydrogenase
MGFPMARNLHAAGFDVWGFDVRPVSDYDTFQNRMVEDAGDFASRVDTVISVVRDWKQTLDLCFGEQGLFKTPDYPKTLIVSSTLSPRVISSLKERLPNDVDLLDAPMSGAPFRAENATLTFMVGGADKTVSVLMPVFEAMGETVHHLGATGAGLTCKVVNNFVASSSVVAVRRALNAAEGLGVERRTILDVMRSSSGGTWFGNSFDDIDWAREGYDRSNTMGILEKDMLSYLDALEAVPGQGEGLFEQAILENLRNMEPLEK